MREILFRGKDADYGEWVYGYYAHLKNMHDVKADIIYTGYADMYMGSILSEFYEVNPKTIGQYTGLKDKNGTRVFEGDILSGYLDDLFPEEESRYEVIWHDYGWHIRANGLLDTPDNGWLKENFEVIGNIHDNPELLEVKQ